MTKNEFYDQITEQYYDYIAVLKNHATEPSDINSISLSEKPPLLYGYSLPSASYSICASCENV